jgi:hypothetical protein
VSVGAEQVLVSVVLPALGWKMICVRPSVIAAECDGAGEGARQAPCLAIVGRLGLG